MGLYAGRSDPRQVDVAAIGAAMRPSLEAWFSAHIVVIDPATLAATPYNARTDTGGDADPNTLWDSGPRGALLQALPRSLDVADFGDQSFGLQQIRIQTRIPEGVQLRTGLVVVVIDGGNDPQLTGEHISLDSVITGSLGWDAILRGRVVAQ